MPRQLLFATNNLHKVQEVVDVAGTLLDIRTPSQVGINTFDPEETADTLRGNALLKATALYDLTGRDCFAEDTGLEVYALHGAPGVHTARFAGPNATPTQNIDKLLKALDGEISRSAQFHTVIALYLDGTVHFFEGIVEGSIANQRIGSGGFGYDPVFVPTGFDKTFGELSPDVKNTISHRTLAVHKMLDFLKRQDQM